MLQDIKQPDRKWDYLLVVDTSRLYRGRYKAQIFKHEAERLGVHILYSKIPEADPLIDPVIIGVMEIFDELHSSMSREKGLAGMRENVRQGYRAGGRAPKGYRLEKIATGAVRDGEPVTKSKLIPSDDAPFIARFLKARAAGRSRMALIKELGLDISSSSANAIEHNALVYAGHTVWNTHAAFERGDGYKRGKKRRPREEWVIKHNTHEALITDEEAEQILQMLEAKQRDSRERRTPADYLLSGMLKTPSGDAWFGDGKRHYRTKPAKGEKSRWVPKSDLEDAVVGQIKADMRSDDFIKQLTTKAREKYQKETLQPADDVRATVEKISNKIGRMLELAAGLSDPAPALREIDKLEKQRTSLAAELAQLEREQESLDALKKITEKDVRRVLNGILEDMDTMHREALKDLLGTLTEKILLDPDSLECRIHYRIGIENRNKMASPRGVEPLSPP